MNLLPAPVQVLLDPWIFMGSSAYYLPPTIIDLVRTRQWPSLFSWSRLQSIWFARFWSWAGPQVSSGGRERVLPLLEGRVRNGRETSKGDGKGAWPAVSGTVIEVGAGSGMWVPLFKDLLDSSSARVGDAKSAGAITKIYGVEPNTHVHGALKQRVLDCHLEDVYEVVAAGIEDLDTAASIAKGSVDSVVCILCLCGIPEPQKNIRALYDYLKPGGRMYVYEHVRCTSHWSAAWYQRLVNIFWPHMLGGCQLLRETGRYLEEAGPWSDIDLGQPPLEPWYKTLPHIIGVLTK